MMMSSSSRRKPTISRTRKSRTTKLLFLFVSFFFLLIFFLRPHYHHHQQQHEQQQQLLPTLKQWPNLPSLLPWTPSSPATRPRSCEAYFGNGFSQKIDVLTSESDGGWFRCFYSETLRSSVCEGGGIRMDPGKIWMSEGGEELKKVTGREEEEELPKFEDGAFVIEEGVEVKGGRRLVDGEFLDKYMPRGAVVFHTMRELVGSIKVVGGDELRCSQWIDNPTLFVTRFEYANMFHTVTDWYSAYVSSRVTKLPKRPDLVFVDGHCKAPLEEMWEALFSSLRYAKNFTSPVCFRHAILSPLGYETALFKGLSESFSCQGVAAPILRQHPDDLKTARISEFGELIRASFNLTVDERMVVKGVSGHNVLFVRRENYLAHPRHNGKVQSRLSNEQEVFDSIKKWAESYKRCKVNVINGLFAHMSMKDQVHAIQEASVIIGAHGAGLTHLVAATKDTKVLEIISSAYNRPHFRLISEWKGLDYHPIHLAGFHAEPSTVIRELRIIMERLDC